MKLTRGLLSLALVFSLGFVSFFAIPSRYAIAQDSTNSLQRGYRTGYSDGYMAGYRDVSDNATRDYSRHDDYTAATRAYNKDYGAVEDYRDGYQQGFESGYNTGFDKRSFDSAMPVGLSRRGVMTQPNPPDTVVAENSSADKRPYKADPIQKVSWKSESDAVIIIPKDTELILELQDDISTASSKEGDRFTAKVVSPAEISGALIECRINKIQKPGRIKKRSELSMSFDRIVLNETRWSNMSAILTEVLPVKGDNVRRVDDEGTAVGKSSIKPDSIKVGAATGTGAVIGAVAGGPVGAAVGAGVGAAFGVGAVVIERGKHIKLNQNQQLRVKTAYETQIR